jgi:CheY-like chemotaxis protein
MTTAYPAPDTLSECIKHGADALLAKPVDLDELKNVARSLAD